MEKVVIVAALRTPIASFGGALKDISAVKLGETVVQAALSQLNLQPNQVDELIFGNVLQAGLGQNVARQVAVNSGLPVEVPSFTVNKVCGSGLKAVALAAQAIRAGDSEVIIAGGTENMSQAPYLVMNGRYGQRMGDGVLVDSMIRDGLEDSFNHYHMGITAENVAAKFKFSRAEQDELAFHSQRKAQAALASGRFQAELVPVPLPQRRGEPILFQQDEYPRANVTLESLAKLRPAFKKEGTVTAANSSGINDGAAVLVLMSAKKAQALNLPVLAEVLASASAGVGPEVMGTGPIPATKKALAQAGLSVEDLDLIEANEAFAAQALSVMNTLKFDPAIVNVNGGAIALGHPIGASGARILVTLLHEMEKRKSSHGLATLCIGGGQGIALVVKRPKEEAEK